MRVLSIISLIFTIIILVALIVFFAIEKTIPLDWAKQTIINSANEIKIADFDSVNKKGKLGYRKVVTEYSYSKTGIKTVSSRFAVKVELVGSDNNMIVRKVVTEYDTLLQPKKEEVTYYYKKNDATYRFKENTETEIMVTEWKNEIVSALRGASPVDAYGEFLYADIINDIERVSQIGVYVNGHIKNEKSSLVLSYDFMNRQLKSLKHTIDTKSGDVVESTTETEYQVLFPSSLTLPEIESK